MNKNVCKYIDKDINIDIDENANKTKSENKIWGLCEAFEYDLKHAPGSYIALGHPKDKILK